MMMDVRLLEATMDEIQAVLDAERNQDVLQAICEEARALEGAPEAFMEVVRTILEEAGVL
jgi:chorismate mutase